MPVKTGHFESLMFKLSILVFLSLLLAWYPARHIASMSYDSSKGQWMQSKHPDFECGKLHLCTHLNETFYRDGKAVEDASADGIVSPFFDDKKGCAMLEKVKNILDSQIGVEGRKIILKEANDR